jgi:hypothetical protein
MKPIIKTVFRIQKLNEFEPQTLPSKEWIVRYTELQKIDHREKAFTWSLMVFSLALISTLAIYLLEGFHLHGFTLPNQLLTGMEYLTVGQVSGLVMVVFKFLFKG